MKKLILLFLGVLLISSGAFCKEKRVLVYTRNYKTGGGGFVHENIPYSVAAIIKLGKENKFAVDTSSDPTVFTEKNLKKYDAVIFANSNNEAFANDMQRLAFRRYIEAGGGFVGIHSSTGSERTWKWFIQMQGATFHRHAKYQKFRVMILDNKHKTAEKLPVVWETEDELYYFKKINPDINVVLVSDLIGVDDPEKSDCFNDVSLSTWSLKFDGGRQWYTALGHNPKDYSDPIYLQHLLNGIKWVMDHDPLNFSKAYAKDPYEPAK